jgi:uncharacterized protein (DUF2345 family)
MVRTVSVMAMVLAGTAGIAPAASAAVNFAGNEASFAGDCGGQEASIAGSGNTVTIRGDCRSLQVAGDGNRVLVDMAANGNIKVYGSNNQVSWSSKGEVEITTAGPGNTVSRAR